MLIQLQEEYAKTKGFVAIKYFKDVATFGKSTMGWFQRFKLHIIINDKGELLNFAITQANVDDREPSKNKGFLKSIFGKLFGYQGYISEKLKQLLFVVGIQLKFETIENNQLALY